MKINEINKDMVKIPQLFAEVTECGEVHEFTTIDAKPGKCQNFTVQDETGKIQVILFNDQVDKYAGFFIIGKKVEFKHCYAKDYKGNIQIRTGDISKYDKIFAVKEGEK